jgi:hypothetical protein
MGLPLALAGRARHTPALTNENVLTEGSTDALACSR